MNKKAATQFAQWLKATHPDVFMSVLQHVQPVNHLGDFTDVLSSVGDAIGSAASSVGDFVSNPQNIQALSTVATAYFKSQTPNPSLASAQGAVFNTQLARAQAGLPPAPIAYSNGQPVYASASGTYPLTPTGLSQLQPTFFHRYGMVLMIGGGFVLLLGLLTR